MARHAAASTTPTSPVIDTRRPSPRRLRANPPVIPHGQIPTRAWVIGETARSEAMRNRRPTPFQPAGEHRAVEASMIGVRISARLANTASEVLNCSEI